MLYGFQFVLSPLPYSYCRHVPEGNLLHYIQTQILEVLLYDTGYQLPGTK